MNESTAGSSSTTLRPRNRHRTRDSEEGESSAPSKLFNFLDGSPPSASQTRTPSPVPKPNPSRLGRDQRLPVTNGFLRVPPALNARKTTSSFAGGLWESSWASLQGIASNLIGNDISQSSSPNRSPTRRKRIPDPGFGVRNTSAPPAQWGPSRNPDKPLAAGTKEDRQAQVQAKKREALLAANGHIGPDATRLYKRRDSEERARNTVENEEQDALVYVHKVKPQDSQMGVTIRYNCPPAVFRKANRLWPNDSIQIRKVVVLPVDACGVRGLKIAAPEGEALLDLESSSSNAVEDTLPTPTAMNPHLRAPSEPPTVNSLIPTPLSSIPTSPSISFALSNPDEPPWTHDSWVRIDNFPEPVEIARLSRKALGYFPRSRRKSHSFSDLDTPSASLDLPRPSYQSSRSARAGSGGAGVTRTGSTSKSRSSSSSQFVRTLQGPGGVGTMSNNVRKPGPAQDGLNKMFAAHLPNLAPKSSFETLQAAAAASGSGSGSGSGIGNGGLENIGGAIEGWMRKVASRASNSIQTPSGTLSNSGGGGYHHHSSTTSSVLGNSADGNYRAGDIIELSEDAFEVGEDDEDDRGAAGADITKPRVNQITGWTAQEQEDMLHERFPPRGRVFGDTSRRGRSR